MCGLAGIWSYGGRSPERADVERMLDIQAYRGPDDAGIWQDGPVTLGHRRLAIIDTTDRSHQPMLTPDGQGVLIYNGQTYNYAALRTELEAEGIVFRSKGDTEVVLQALHHWGPERSIPLFDGMFAFAYFDRRHSTLWLARDKVGIKPLVVSEIGNWLLFASEVKALLAHPRMEKRLDRHGLSSWIIRPRRPAHRILLEGIDGVAPGAWWKITSEGIEKRQYFDVLTQVDADRIIASYKADPTALVDEAETLLRTSVTLHLASDVPLAAMCSGGVDSSLITAYAREHKTDIPAYVADVPFDGGEADQAERAGRHLGVNVRRVRVDRERYLRLWPLATWHMDGPPAHHSDPALLAVTEACHQDGIKVLLTGEGADELFGGYSGYRSTYRRWRQLEWPWQLLLPTARMRRRHRETLAVDPFASSDGYAPNLEKRLIAALDPEDEFLPASILKVLSAVERPADRAFLAHCFADIHYNLMPLLHRHDRMGMASSIEMRVPFLENDLFDFAFHLPRWAKLRRGTGKWVVKAAAARQLPSDIVFAKKKGFPIPEFYTRGTEQLIVDGALASHLKWNPAATLEILEMLKHDNSLRYVLVGAEIWLRMFFLGETAEEVGERLVALAA